VAGLTDIEATQDVAVFINQSGAKKRSLPTDPQIPYDYAQGKNLGAKHKMTVLAEYSAIIGGYTHFVSFTEHLAALLGRISLEGYRKQKLADLLYFFLDQP